MSFSRRKFLGTVGAAGVAAPLSLSVARATATPSKILIGQIGTGHAHASGKTAAMRHSPDFELVGVVEPDPHLRAVAEQNKVYSGVKWVTEEELLNTPGLQAVAVETAVKDLLPTAARCVAADKHIHLDKPAGESLAGYKRLLEEATRRKLTVQMGYMFRYNPAFQLAYQLVREGTLGDIFELDTVMNKNLGAGERARLLPYRGGSMFELGCHVIDSVVTLLGRPQKVTAHNRSVAGDGLPDNQLAVLEYPSATVTVRSAVCEVRGEQRRQFVVCGTRGTYDIRLLEPPTARLALEKAQGDYKAGYQDISLPPMAGRYDGDFLNLAKVIRGEKAFGFSPEHDIAVQETVLLASGLPVE